MRTAMIGILALGLTTTGALAQTSSSPGSSSGAGTTSPGSTSPGTSVGRGAPALGATPSGPATPNRSNSATRTGKNSSNETVADCMKLWEPTTHMSKADWSRTCRRVQGRLDEVTKQVMTK